MPPPRPFFRSLVAVAALAVLAGCGTSEYAGRTSSATEEARRLPPRPASEVESRLLEAAAEWMGTPYRFGGTTTRGVDCSALVRAVYDGAFGLRLTRSTKTQVREGRPVGRHELRSGDLVFFRTGPDQRHVGIYLDGDRLLHASSSQNRVMVDDLGREHFQRTYWTARRLLDVEPGAAPAYAETTPAAPLPQPATPPPAGPARPGW
jgi:cell wall-associated NlpC family hydrolase